MSSGFRNIITCHVFGEIKIHHFQCSKKRLAPSAPEFIITDQWSSQLRAFPEPPNPQFWWGGSIAPPPAPELKT